MKYSYLLLSGSLLVSLSTVGKELKTPDFSLLNQQISQTKAFAKLPFGTSIIAIKNDEIIYAGHSGFTMTARFLSEYHDTRVGRVDNVRSNR